MATKSEDIRLQMNNVKYKKGDGVLYLMGERLAWMPNSKNNFALSHKYSDIKMQKISPEGKAKIQLQIVLQTGDNTTFQFANLEDRTAVKDALLQILPQFKGKMPKDRERKALILSKNPNLLQLYKDLVETKIISVDEFWSQFASDTDIGDTQMEQEVGVSANFMSGIPLNGKQVKGTVSAETLFAILKTYPKVAKLHQELVPTKMTETEFWNKFFQSRYFNRDRTKDMFTDLVKSDEKEWKQCIVSDPFLDVELFDDNAYRNNPGDAPPDNHEQSLIKRFNQQSIRLIDSLSQTRPGQRVTSRKDGLSVDLNNPDDQDIESDFRANNQHWPRDMYSFLPQTTPLSASLINEHSEALKSWEPRSTNCLSSNDATEALKNLSPSGILMRSSDQNQLADTVPEELQAKLKSAYFASNELLRHFWLCFPAVEPSLEAKLCKLHDTIKKFETTKIQPLHDSLPRDHRHLLNHLMRRQFKEASNKFEDWKNKRRAREMMSAKK
uniref:General transcription factor IIH subunit 1 n=1 Tax=Aceria tosichella TaxID=561515 RepID=A0A6G1S720_9ACAR